MNDSRDALSDLVSGAGKEIERLARVESVDLRDELRFRVWPFLVELGETLHATLDEEVNEASAPVDVIARAVGVMLTLINRLGEHLAPAYMEDIARRAAAVMEELMNLCDPDDLAAYVANEGTPSAIVDPHTLEPVDPDVIDTTAQTVAAEPSALAPAPSETPES
jgi:hypothetical protein